MHFCYGLPTITQQAVDKLEEIPWELSPATTVCLETPQLATVPLEITTPPPESFVISEDPRICRVLPTSPDFKTFTRATNTGNKARWWAGGGRSLNNVYKSADISNNGSHVHMFTSNAEGCRHLRLPRAAPFNAIFAVGQGVLPPPTHRTGRKNKSDRRLFIPPALKGVVRADAPMAPTPQYPLTLKAPLLGPWFLFRPARSSGTGTEAYDDRVGTWTPLKINALSYMV